MKSFKIALIAMTFALLAVSGCKQITKATGGIVDGNDVAKSVAKGLVDMSFGSGANGPFDVVKTKIADATLVIQNSTDRTITVKTTGPTNKTFIVPKGKTESAQVKPGQYHFDATAPNTSGAKGDCKLEGYKQYTWEFVIR